MFVACAACRQAGFGADRVLGVDGYVTRGACRMACLLGVQQAFAKAELARAEVAGWDLDDNTIRPLGHATAGATHRAREDRTPVAAFTAATGDPEIPIDAGKVNTFGGWRDVQVGVFLRRERGRSMAPGEWDERDLRPPSVRSVIAAVEDAAAFGPRCRAEADRVERTDPRAITALGEGAEWIGNRAAREFPGAAQVLDVWHAAEWLADGAKAVFGDGTEAAKAAARTGRSRLLEDGYHGVVDWIGTLTGVIPAGGDGAALGGVLNYFAGHQDRLNYAVRRRRGQSIGSGMVEGSVKQLRNKRLKQTGARWKVEHVGPFVELGALAAGPEWKGLW